MATQALPREEPGIGPAERRAEPRREAAGECSILFFRGAAYVVPVVNISSRGTMIESDLRPRLGESVIIRFAGCSPIHAFVRWAKDGRVGLNFGCELILGGAAGRGDSYS